MFVWLIVALAWVDGPIVENPIDTKPRVEMVFEEELRVTSDDDERLFFGGRFLDLDIDKAGNMYVAHGNENTILVISPKGDLITILGGKGKGPGEFENLKGFKVYDNGSALAFESSNNTTKLHSYDQNLKHLKTHTMQKSFTFYDWIPSPDGQYFAGMGAVYSEKGEKNYYGVVDRNFEQVFSFHEYTMPHVAQTEIDKPEFWLKFIPSRLQFNAKGEVPVMAMDRNGNLFTAIEKRYEITKWSPTGEKLLTFRKKHKPLYQSDEEILAMINPLKESLESQVPMVRSIFTTSFLKKVIEKSGFTNTHHPVNGLCVTDTGHILVVTESSFKTRNAKADVFDEKGVYIGKSSIKGNGFGTMKFRDNKAYSLSKNDDDEWYIVRYRYYLKNL